MFVQVSKFAEIKAGFIHDAECAQIKMFKVIQTNIKIDFLNLISRCCGHSF